MSQKASPTTGRGSGKVAGGGTWALLDTDEFEDLQKFVSVLATKCAGIIVESRSGQKCFNPSNPAPPAADWFGLAVKESTKLRSDMKEVTSDHTAVIDKPFGVEIIAHLPTKEEILLEYWWLSFDSRERDQDVRVKYMVYNRMAILLKSIVVVLRSSPVHKFVQQNEYFKFSHRFFSGKPNLKLMEAKAKDFKIGPLKTPYGSIYFSGVCRETAFSDYPISHPLTEPVAHPPERPSSNPKIKNERRNSIAESPENPGFVAGSPLETRVHVEVGQLPRPRFNSYTKPGRNATTFAELHCIGAFAGGSSKSPSDSDDDTFDIPEKAFASLVSPPPDEEDDADFAAKKAQPLKPILKEAPSKSKTEPIAIKTSRKAAGGNLSLTDDGFEEEDIMDAEMRPAFAPSKRNPQATNLASFFYEFQLAPVNLESLQKKGVSVARTVKTLNQNLNNMESDLKEFDRFVDDLKQIGDSSWIMANE